MNLSQKCTLFVPLKDKHAFTLRLCLYLNAIKCPYKILFADGSLTDKNEKVLKNYKHLFPNLDFEYHKFPPDNTLLDFSKKLAKICKLIKTPYCKGVSNDDFPILETIPNCISFLDSDEKHEYTSCGGTSFRLISSGFLCKLLQKVYYKPINIEFLDSDPIKRITSQIPYLGANIQHSVSRTNAVLYSHSFTVREKISTAYEQEYFFAKAMLLLGKHKQLNQPLLIWDKRMDNWSFTIRTKENRTRISQLYLSLAKELAQKNANININQCHERFIKLHYSYKINRLMVDSSFLAKTLPYLKYKLFVNLLNLIPNTIINSYQSIKFSFNKNIAHFLKVMNDLCIYNDLLKNVQNL